MKYREIGLIAGRHEMPVGSYLLDSVVDPLDVQGINHALMESVEKAAEVCVTNADRTRWIETEMEYHELYEIGDVSEAGKYGLTVYVTGLTPVTVELINVCMSMHVSLTLMHYNRETGEYVSQHVFSFGLPENGAE